MKEGKLNAKFGVMEWVRMARRISAAAGAAVAAMEDDLMQQEQMRPQWRMIRCSGAKCGCSYKLSE